MCPTFCTLGPRARGHFRVRLLVIPDRWDQLIPTEGQGHLTHGLGNPDSVDAEYRPWVSEFHLALSPAVEGLGTDELRRHSRAVRLP